MRVYIQEWVRKLKVQIIGHIDDNMIPFNKLPIVGTELNYIKEVVNGTRLSGDNCFIERYQKWMEKYFQCLKVLLTPSCTASLEMAAILLNIKRGDEIIMPSFTFTSTANAFILRGVIIVFIDICPDTINMDENKIKTADYYTQKNKTRVIVVVHYAGMACEMDTIMILAEKHHLYVVVKMQLKVLCLLIRVKRSVQ